VDEPSGVKRKESNQPSDNEDDGDNVKKIIHKNILAKK
jgi:hypothetical protein